MPMAEGAEKFLRAWKPTSRRSMLASGDCVGGLLRASSRVGCHPAVVQL